MFTFVQKADRRSRTKMIEFLESHPKHDGFFANNVKIHSIGLTKKQEEKAWELRKADDEYEDLISGAIEDFTEDHGNRYTAVFAGRMSGHIELRVAEMQTLEYKSYCRSCHNRTYGKVAPELPTDPLERAVAEEILNSRSSWRDEVYLGQESIKSLTQYSDTQKLDAVRQLRREWSGYMKGNRCGRCGAVGENGMVNYTIPPQEFFVTNKPIYELPYDWMETYQIRRYVDLVMDFDRTCDLVRKDFIRLLKVCKVKEETIMVPTTRTRLECGL